jgi:hypothetical protein
VTGSQGSIEESGIPDHAVIVHFDYVTDRAVRRAVRFALAHQLGLDIPGVGDGAGPG